MIVRLQGKSRGDGTADCYLRRYYLDCDRISVVKTYAVLFLQIAYQKIGVSASWISEYQDIR
jgi:hypothetical protein